MTRTLCKKYLMCIVNLMFWDWVKMERIYSITSDLAPLLETQRNVISDLSNTVERKKEILHFVQKEIERYSEGHKKMKTSLENSCMSSSARVAIKRFFVIKRLTDMNSLKTHLEVQNAWNRRNVSMKYPTLEDLVEAVRMIERVQKFYRLNVTQLADGILNTSSFKNGDTYNEFFLPMTSSDCFQISKIIYKLDKNGQTNYKKRLLWLLEAYRLYESENHNPYNSLEKVAILRDICEGYDAINDHYNYVLWAKKLVALESTTDPSIEVKIHSHEMQIRETNNFAKQKQTQKVKKKEKEKLKIEPLKELRNCLKGLDHKTYRMLCRGEVTIAPEVSKRLKCWYSFGYHPFTTLAPYRTEQLYLQPDVLLVHNFVSDIEIQTLKRIALPKLGPTTAVNGPRTLTSMVYLISKGAELNAIQSRVISRRIGDFTGHATDSTLLSVTNYGVGGHYVGHVDGTGRPDKERLKRRYNFTDADTEILNNMIKFLKEVQRTASVLIYLSEVELGGATVFPVIGLSVFPIKGAALVWSNLLPSEDLDYATCHGACPVLRGSKWTASHFIRHEGQELKKPCTKEFTSRIIEEIPAPILKTGN